MDFKKCKLKLSEAKDADENRLLQLAYREALEKYNNIRYRDTRVYTPKVLEWKTSFAEYMHCAGYKNPERNSRMAIDVLLDYEEENGIALTYSDLLSVEIFRRILAKFCEREDITASSKVKYIKMFKLMMFFLLGDFSSSEIMATDPPADILRRKSTREDLVREIFHARNWPKKEITRVKNKSNLSVQWTVRFRGISCYILESLLQVNEAELAYYQWT